jgi:hypothetical protein
MSWRDNLTDAQARLATLEAAELKVLAGEQVRSVGYDGDRVEYAQGATTADLQRAIFEVRQVINRLSGACRTGGRIVPTFGR